MYPERQRYACYPIRNGDRRQRGSGSAGQHVGDMGAVVDLRFDAVAC